MAEIILDESQATCSVTYIGNPGNKTEPVKIKSEKRRHAETPTQKLVYN